MAPETPDNPEILIFFWIIEGFRCLPTKINKIGFGFYRSKYIYYEKKKKLLLDDNVTKKIPKRIPDFYSTPKNTLYYKKKMHLFEYGHLLKV